MSDENDDAPPPRSKEALPLDLEQTQVGGSYDPGVDPEVAAFQPVIDGYADLRELHRGGQGIVYRALQLSTRRTVAIKVLREGPQADSAARKRFQREVEIVAQLNHPHIVSIFDSGTTSTTHPYFVMEYVHGVELDQHVHQRALSIEDTLQVFRVVLDAAHHAHENGVVHRDLKPSNILVDDHGQPKLVDFGLARTLVATADSFASLTGQVLGTMAYMSPEQVRANPEEIDGRTDVYSLGVILYEILTGSTPYPETTRIVEILRHITETPPKRPARAWSSQSGIHRRSERRRSVSGKCPIDSELETILLKAIAKEKERRYASAHGFSTDIGRYLDGRPIEARRDSGIYIIRKKLQRNRRPVLFGTAGIAVFGAALLLVADRGEAPARKLDPQAIALYEAAETDYVRERDALRQVLDSRITAGELQLDALTQSSLQIVTTAVEELQSALQNDRDNPDLRHLLLRAYEREVELLKRIATLPGS